MIIDFDKYSLIFDKSRIQIRSAALHYFRCPGTDVWRDRLSKIKAGGYNAVDIYFNWGYHSKEQGIYDFTDIRDIRELLDITMELGLYVIARPGPFINGEVSAGGFPFWLFNIPGVILRNRDDGNYVYSEPYMQAVKDWYSRILPIINEYHNVIALQVENEYSTNEAEPDYIQELYDYARMLGIKVPIFHNDAYCACLYSDIVNIYACDIYPTINLCDDWHESPYIFDVLDNAEENLKPCTQDSPLYVAELQSGWFDKWGGKGYKYIRDLFGKNHINIVTKTALSQGITMFNHYMGCGGTSWGNLASDDVYSSYDFAAPISESGIPGENYYKAKEINYFLHAYNLSSTDLIAREDNLLAENCENIFARLRQDNQNNCKWLFIRNLNSDRKEIKLQNIPSVSLQAFDMKILPIDLDLYGCNLDFSSLSIFGRIEKEDYEVIFFLIDDFAELTVSGYESRELCTIGTAEEFDDKVKIRFVSIPAQDMFSCKFMRNNKTTEFIFLKEATADKTWILENNAVIGPEIILDNPYKAAISNDTIVKTINLTNKVEWKEKNIKFSKNFEVPKLGEWNSFRCSPEIDPGYDDSNWDFVKNSESLDCISNKIYDEFIWYKGSFNGIIEQIQLSAKHCYAIYINGLQIYQHDSLHSSNYSEFGEFITINVDDKYLNKDKNEITILVQNLGFDKGFCENTNLPRGILRFKTLPEKDIKWKIRGGLTPEIEEWAFVPIDNLDNASNNAYLSWHCATFNIEKSTSDYAPLCLTLDNPDFDKANIYLNGNLIGRYWKTMGPQTKFYLMDGFLKQKNLLSLAVWNRNTDPQQIEDYKFSTFNVNINIETISHYNMVNLAEIL